ncbi:MAG: hypothetical protein EBT03_10485 [Betaproteobacteria bacterium]|nr:hypothetical protein [Betaproteobacteria bacterium]
MENIDVQALTPNQIVRAYKGKIGCMCGCKGQYWTPEQSKAMVTKILRTIQANEEVVEVDDGGEWVAARIAGKEHCVYLR